MSKRKIEVVDQKHRDVMQELLRESARFDVVTSLINNISSESWYEAKKKHFKAAKLPKYIQQENKLPMCTIAWCKMFEMLHRNILPISSQLNTLHLCEAPGAFVQALRYYLIKKAPHTKLRWTASSLAPNDPLAMRAPDDFMKLTQDNWILGDLFDEKIQHAIKERCEDSCNFITADGSLDCDDDPELQEISNLRLFKAEFTTALSAQANHGVFVCKMFGMQHVETRKLITIMRRAYKSIAFLKPDTSKPTNAECYVVFTDFNPLVRTETIKQLNNMDTVDVEENPQLIQTAVYLMKKQLTALGVLIEDCARPWKFENEDCYRDQKRYNEQFREKYM